MFIKKFLNLKNSYFIGKKAEYKCQKYLKSMGFKIIKTNFKTTLGEIDIIATKENLIVAFEVKFRSDSNYLAYSISKIQQRRVSNAFLLFLQYKTCYNTYHKRFDALLVNKDFEIQHLTNTW